MLEKLDIRPWCVCELATELGISKSVASKHLAQLKSAGIIDDEKHGTLVEYRLTAKCIIDMTRCVESAVLKNKKSKLEITIQP